MFQWGFPGDTSGKEPVCQCKRHKKSRVRSLGPEDPLEEGMATHSNILTSGSNGQRSLAGYGSWVAKSRTGLKLLSMYTYHISVGM